ncbi:MAG: ribonuclease P protein component [Planctomycetes bacterium]|jgi:ribonuclease P protein component|nr:ribonuclease P protein component [Planctomycetota bacterium]
MPDSSFPKSARLLVRAQFDAVFALKQSAGDRRLVIFWRKNELGHSRLGLAVNTAFGNAVKRNKFKRRVRELFRKSKLGAFDLVVLPARHAEAKKAGYLDLAQSWQRLTARLA